ncbi:unnamed protein product [Cercopithifilaria johnstoni]|uniref:Uncharacterized protein n=1 Tax=Cercopithifilaria johnstoni TaxID=2874296 RepID=A0A8J2M2B8_9BILA|nr:unnamed protein product [Cercopithifilaria johnstoni]
MIVIELPNDVNIQLAAAIACCFQNIRNSQCLTGGENTQQSQVFQNIEQFATARTMISNLTRISRHKTQVGQSRQISSQPVHLIPGNSGNRTQAGILTTEVGIPTKIAEWRNKLDHLSFLFSSLSNGTMSAIQMCAELDVQFRDLITFLCHTSSTRRPVTVSDPVEIYAGSLVKLHQYCVVGTDNDSERVLYAAIYEVISFWLRFLHRNNLNKYGRLWLHTRAVITRMFRSIIIQECILVIKHSLASMLKELTMLVLESSEYSYGFYACEQMEEPNAVPSTTEIGKLGNLYCRSRDCNVNFEVCIVGSALCDVFLPY